MFADLFPIRVFAGYVEPTRVVADPALIVFPEVTNRNGARSHRTLMTAAGFGFSPNAEAVARVPRALAFRHDALPLAVVDGVLAVALPDPDDAAVVDALRAATRLKLRPLPMPREAIREKLRVAYGELPAGGARDASGDAPAVRAVDLRVRARGRRPRQRRPRRAGRRRRRPRPACASTASCASWRRSPPTSFRRSCRG